MQERQETRVRSLGWEDSLQEIRIRIEGEKKSFGQ